MSRSFGAIFVTSRSPMKICPSLTSSRPASIRRVVDLPHPDGPTSTMNSPSSISRSIPGTAGLSAPGYQRCAFWKLTVAMFVSPSPAGTCRTIRCEVEVTRTRDEGHTRCWALPVSAPSLVDPPRTSGIASRWTPVVLRMRASTATAPSAANGRDTEVNDGRSHPARSEPSKETTATSSGTRTPLGQRLVGAHRDPVVEADEGTDRLAAEERLAHGLERRY